jgi:hypothetical protein
MGTRVTSFLYQTVPGSTRRISAEASDCHYKERNQSGPWQPLNPSPSLLSAVCTRRPAKKTISLSLAQLIALG